MSDVPPDGPEDAARAPRPPLDVAALQGDPGGDAWEAAWAVAVGEVGPAVARRLRAFVSDDARIADSVQEAFVRAFRRINATRATSWSTFEAWITAIALNVLVDEGRAADRRTTREAAAALAADIDADNEADIWDALCVRDTAERVLAKLSPHDRRYAGYYFITGATHRHVAAECHITELTSMNKKQRVLRKLRAVIRSLDDPPPGSAPRAPKEPG